MKEKTRCTWVAAGDELYEKYHDEEWGVPCYDDRKLFEHLVLEGAQAGLSWRTILARRENYWAAFADFDPRAVAKFTDDDVERLVQDVGIIRNRLKIQAAITNARQFLNVQKEFGSCSAYQWQFVQGHPLDHACKSGADVPVTSPEAQAFSKDLKKRGFAFVGPTTIYAHMQAMGMINDHTIDCFRYEEVKRLAH